MGTGILKMMGKSKKNGLHLDVLYFVTSELFSQVKEWQDDNIPVEIIGLKRVGFVLGYKYMF